MNATDLKSDRTARFRAIAACFLSQNIAMGLGFGSFGPLMALNEAHFGISRTLAATGMSMITIALSLVAPLLGGWLQRVELRNAMIGGAVLSMASYAALGFLNNYLAALVCYVLIGATLPVLAFLGPLNIITRWVDESRGKVLGLVNLPLIMFFAPYLIASTLPDVGRLNTYLAMAALFALLIPCLFMIRTPPVAPAKQAPGAAAQGISKDTSPLRSLPFWTLSVGIGIIAGAGIIFVVHIVPYGVTRALSAKDASGILSIYSGAGLIGTLIFGWLADKLTPPRALALGAAVLSLCWIAIIHGTVAVFLPAAVLMGICGVPITTLHGAAMSALFGPEGAGRAMGYSFVIKLPFLIGAAPLAGLLFELDGNYQRAFNLCAAGLLLGVVLFATVAVSATRAHKRRLAAAY